MQTLKTVSLAVSLVVLLAVSSASAAPQLSFFWSGTTGSGTTGSDTIDAALGDELTLDVVLTDDGTGLSGFEFALVGGSAATALTAQQCPAGSTLGTSTNFIAGQCLTSTFQSIAETNPGVPIVGGNAGDVTGNQFDNITFPPLVLLTSPIFLGQVTWQVTGSGNITIGGVAKVADKDFVAPDLSGTIAATIVVDGSPGGDSDGDGVPDDEDVCPGGDDNVDTDGDGVPDDCDACPVDASDDTDGDGVCDSEDICPDGDDAVDTDGDGVPDDCDDCPLDSENDADSDGFCETDDNCPDQANADQSDLDADGRGDVCDPDVDGDDVPNGEDNCEFDSNPGQEDADGDGMGDACDADVDGDGVVDADDACVPTAPGDVVDADGCSIAQLCACDNDWKNHGAYVSCVTKTAKDFVDAGLLDENEKGSIVSEAARSDCGQRK